MREHLFTSESVSEGHPDKVADRISDAVLDWLIERDPEARVACETLVAKDRIVVAGEFGTKRIENVLEALETAIPDLARQTVRDIGYSGGDTGFDPDQCMVELSLNEQSRDIDAGVTRGGESLGAGDQGLMFGYAVDETPELMPLPIGLAHALVRRQAEVRRSGELPWLRPDAKSQVTVRYADGRPVAVDTIVLSTQHAPSIDQATLKREVFEHIIEPSIPQHLCTSPPKIHVNPTGSFEIGGPAGDVGLTGRKIIVDTYGGSCAHGGGAFSGKDPTKVDRSAAYAARHVAKNIVGAGLARVCTVQLAYAIGVEEPVSVYLDTARTGIADDIDLEEAVRKVFDLTPAGIIRELELRRPIYGATAAYGHFGRQGPEFTWELLDRVEALREAAGVRVEAKPA